MAVKSDSTPKKRPTWDEYFLSIAQVVRSRSNCLRMDVGAILVRDRRIIATGYNGTPSGTTNCNEGGCERCLHRSQKKLEQSQQKELCVCVHAEQNALLQSAYHGVSTKDSVLYATVEPCLQCAKALINAGVKSILYDEDHYDAAHHDSLGRVLLKGAGVSIKKLQ